jgi:hypothetical protein
MQQDAIHDNKNHQMKTVQFSIHASDYNKHYKVVQAEPCADDFVRGLHMPGQPTVST